ncbi:MAG: hypothetical protein JW809_11190 [Pirellulales bacterium]|nr:hypothetical protein [Pirellulales bacterium]
MGKWLGAVVLTIALGGCANPRWVDLHNGTFCSAENVQAYAEEHHMTYADALAALRKQSDEMWAEEAAKQAKSKPKPKATVAPEVAPSGSPARGTAGP